MVKITMKVGKIYFLEYGGGAQIIGRFLKDTTTQYIFIDLLHCWNGYETFQQNGPYCVHNGIEKMRAASKNEKMKLVMFEIDHNCI